MRVAHCSTVSFAILVRRRFVPLFEVWLLRLLLIRILRALSGPLPRLFCPLGGSRIVRPVQYVRVALWIGSFGHRPLRLRVVQSERTSPRSVPSGWRKPKSGGFSARDSAGARHQRCDLLKVAFAIRRGNPQRAQDEGGGGAEKAAGCVRHSHIQLRFLADLRITGCRNSAGATPITFENFSTISKPT